MFRKRLIQLSQTSWQERGLLLEAAVLSLGVGLILRIVSFKSLVRYLGQMKQEANPQTMLSAELDQADRVGWAVDRAAGRIPWRNLCLVKAITAKLMLRRRGVGSGLSLGLAKNGRRELQAHAWLSCGEYIVTGRQERERYAVMTTFVE